MAQEPLENLEDNAKAFCKLMSEAVPKDVGCAIILFTTNSHLEGEEWVTWSNNVDHDTFCMILSQILDKTDEHQSSEEIE